ncbi:MAG TPA: recombinase family protein, partial [Caulobacter sp.]|nr:recombinase family protein [Caulobacter sp.]
RALAALEDGGTLAVLSLHALAGTMVDLLDAALKLKARGLHLVVAQPEIDTRADAAFFEACQTLASFNGERALVRTAEMSLVANGVRDGGLRGLKAAASPVEEPETPPPSDA